MIAAGEVLILSGPPGSGKSTVADALAGDAKRSVHLESDWFYRSIRSGFIAPHLRASHAQNTAVMDIATDAAAGYAAAGYAVVWDGIVGPWFLDRIVGRLAAKGVPVRYLVLRASRDVSLERVTVRDRTSELSGAAKMFDEFADLGEFEPHVVDAHGSIDEVIDRCRRRIEGEGLRLTASAGVDDRWPVSVKGVIGWDDRFVVLRNEREEWELPGGRLDATDAGPVEALAREMNEELGLEVEVGALIDSWIYDVEGKRVLILTYRCTAAEPAELSHSEEHSGVAALTLDELEASSMPDGYLRSIRRARDV